MMPEQRIEKLRQLSSEFFITDEEREAIGWAVAKLLKDPTELPEDLLGERIQQLELANVRMECLLERERRTR